MSDKKIGSLIVPVFIPNQGCPHRCIFCEQEKITSQPVKTIDKTHVELILNQALGSKRFDPEQKPEIAFYGGTFTGLPFDQMVDLLNTAAAYIAGGRFYGIRVSTRPDALDDERLKALKHYGVSTVELGVQSMDDRVLNLSNRGHTEKDITIAVRRLKKQGFKVGVQLMPGLPGDSEKTFCSTITKIIRLHPDMARLYPVLVIQNTALARLYKNGAFQPLQLDEAVEICAESCMRLESKGVPVIRIGLMSSPSLLEKGRIVAGPWHPSFGFLVRSAIYQKNIKPTLSAAGKATRIEIIVSERDVPLLRGYKNQGLRAIEKISGAKVIQIQADDVIPRGSIRVFKV